MKACNLYKYFWKIYKIKGFKVFLVKVNHK